LRPASRLSAVWSFTDLRRSFPIDELIGLVIGAVLAFLGSTYAAVLVKRYEASGGRASANPQ